MSLDHNYQSNQSGRREGRKDIRTEVDKEPLDDDQRHIYVVVLPPDRIKSDGIDPRNISTFELSDGVPDKETLASHREGLYFSRVGIEDGICMHVSEASLSESERTCSLLEQLKIPR